MHSTRPEVMEKPVADASLVGRARAASAVTLVTLLVSLAGYFREAALAAHFGVSATMDAYFAATFVPTNIYLILVVGTLSPIFIPLILGKDAHNSQVQTNETVSVVTTFALLVLLIIVSVGIMTARYWLAMLFPGFDQATMSCALNLTYIILPGIVFLGLAGIFTAMLNAFHRFTLAALSPIFSSIVIIVSLLLTRGPRAILIVGVATTVGFFLQFLVLIPSCMQLGFKYVPRLKLVHPAIKKLLRLGAPLFAYLVLCNASAIVERNLASRLSTGAVSAVSYAIRLFAVPANFLAAPLALVSYPQFAREALKRDHGELRQQLFRSIRFVIFIFLPITAWIMINSLALTRIVYERGQFNTGNSHMISRVLQLYAIGILPNAISVILLRCCYAIQDMVSPLLAEVVNFLLYTTVALVLTKQFGLSGLAVARGGTFFVVLAALVIALQKRKVLMFQAELGRLLAKVALASLIAASASYLMVRTFSDTLAHSTTIARIAIVGFNAITTGSLFFSATILWGIPEARYVVDLSRKFMRFKTKPEIAICGES